MGDRIDKKGGFFAIHDRSGRYFGVHAGREGADAVI
jgi:hypothetical protein